MNALGRDERAETREASNRSRQFDPADVEDEAWRPPLLLRKGGPPQVLSELSNAGETLFRGGRHVNPVA
jgi:hypothetical protein